jgi:uncharacterized protein (DUF433 family)/DNA-binding transcriptional MerR regulator
VLGSRGAYPADRAAALSGVPLSTLHDWSRKEVLVPTISAERVKLWSYADLMGLRIIQWLRQTKIRADGADIPRSTMQAVKRALTQLDELDLALWTEESGPSVVVDASGQVLVSSEPHREAGARQRVLDEELEVLAPFPSRDGLRGPDLVAPRPQLRIVPGKLGGSPHVVHTRLESQALGGLADSGLPKAKIYRLYPDIDRSAIDEALDLEDQLEHNLRPIAA